MSKQSKELSPFQVGQLSKEKGLSESSCPYKSGSKEAKEWLKGFNDSGTTIAKEKTETVQI